MATRFYLQASGSAVASPGFDAGWEQTGQAVRLPMPQKNKLIARTTLADAGAVTVPITTTQDILGFQFVSDDVFLPVRITAQDVFSMVIRGLENATTSNAFLAYVLKAVSPDGATSLGTLSSDFAGGGTEFVATAATRIFGNGTTTVALTATTISQPWRLVLEIGAHATGPTAAGSYTYRFGTSAATDFALTSALTTDLNPWMELSLNLNATKFNNFMAVRVGSGMWCSERVR